MNKIMKVCVLRIIRVAVLVLLTVVAKATPIWAETIGMVADNATDSITVFDADTNTVLGTVSIGSGPAIGDCSITDDQTLGFVTNFANQIYVIDLTTSPPSLAPGTNPIPISNPGEDTSISPDQRFLVVCDGNSVQPVSVIDIATQTQISTFSLDTDCNSVDVCSDGSVLVTSTRTDKVRRLVIDEAGTLTDTGEVLAVGSDPNNVFCAPDGTSGVVITRGTDQIKSFTIPGLGLVDTRPLSGSFGVSGLVNHVGDYVFTRDNGTVDVFEYDSFTGALGAAPLFTIPIANARTIFGTDQMVMHPDGTKLYVSQPRALKVYDAGSGALMTSITAPNMVEPTGICFPISNHYNEPPDCSTAVPSVSEIWPPNHQFIEVNVSDVTDPEGETVSITIDGVFQDEPVIKNGTGSGNTCPDGDGIGTDTAWVRAERAGGRRAPGNGRVYHIGFTAEDEAGGACTGEVTVCVPHDRRQGNECVDDEVLLFDSTVCQ